ncbi:HAD family hydrolase [Gabonibacter chumensis]|uniref:HAD family hydrolase n=1 Tax=Gabonibacter chumensis TaxID=2972474 RepID=UPI002573D1FE|nr:HAD family hydrolase [Gabonibacter chumensis]MCR9011772.1 HAD family hydrolase [Gabonibacter chumensis]
MNRLIIFDLDGTLLNSLDDLAISANYALQKHNYPVHELRKYKEFVGNGINKLLERALPEGERTPENVLKIREDFMDYYAVHKADFTAPYPGIMDLLNELKRRGILLAVASNKYHAATQALIPHYFGEDTFHYVYGQREGVPIKPDPTVVFDILKEAGVSREETLYVGDSGVDMQTALNSGVVSIGVTWGFRSAKELEDNGAVHIVDHPSDMLKLLQ